MPMPIIGSNFTFFQPDGTKFQAQCWGDQYHVAFETLDGFTFVKDSVTGFYQYAALSENGETFLPTGFQVGMENPENLGLRKGLRTSRTNMGESAPVNSQLFPKKTRWETRREISQEQKLTGYQERKLTGNYVGLCLLVDFPDFPASITQSEIERLCNLKGYSEFGNNGSVYDYFFDNSGGRLKYTLVVAPYYTAKHNRDYYTDEQEPYGVRGSELIREALDHLRETGFDFSRLSLDSENHVYATNLLYAGEIVNSPATGLWPYSYTLDPVYKLEPDKIIADYQISNIGDEPVIGVICHENGHMICDFPDLYDKGKDKIFSFGVGYFCAMCFGAMDPDLNAKKPKGAKNPAQICAYLKYQAGWVDQITTISNGLRATIQAGRNDFYIHRKNLLEFFIIENRYQAGYDKNIPGSGLAIWHVDEKMKDNDSQDILPSSHYRCSLVQADGKFQLEKSRMPQDKLNKFGDKYDLYYAPDNTTFGNFTVPNSRWWDGSPSGLEISEISASGVSMTFKCVVS